MLRLQADAMRFTSTASSLLRRTNAHMHAGAHALTGANAEAYAAAKVKAQAHAHAHAAAHAMAGYDENSVNPYCGFCKGFFQQATKDEKAPPATMCALQPENQKEICIDVAASLAKNRDVQEILKGCIDKTGPRGGAFAKKRLKVKNRRWPTTDAEWAESEAFMESTAEQGVMKAAKACPPLVACNAIESGTGAPMCGTKLRHWGDFLPLYWRPVPVSAQDLMPEEENTVQVRVL